MFSVLFKNLFDDRTLFDVLFIINMRYLKLFNVIKHLCKLCLCFLILIYGGDLYVKAKNDIIKEMDHKIFKNHYLLIIMLIKFDAIDKVKKF